MSIPSKILLPGSSRFHQIRNYSVNVLLIFLLLFFLKMYLDQPGPGKHDAQVKLVKTKLQNLMAGCRLYWKEEGDDQPCSLAGIKRYGFRPHALVSIQFSKPYKQDFLVSGSHVEAKLKFKMESTGETGVITRMDD